MCLVYWEGRMGCVWFIGRVGWGVCLVYWEGRMGCVWFIGRVGWGIRADRFF